MSEATHVPSEREKQIAARRQRLADTRPPAAQRIRVKPRDDGIRKHIAHPSGIKFRADGDGAVEWPLDSFTKRRLKDGCVMAADAGGGPSGRMERPSNELPTPPVRPSNELPDTPEPKTAGRR